MAWVMTLPWQLWIGFILLAASAITRIAYGERYRDFVRGTLWWWLPVFTDWLRITSSNPSRGRPDL